MHTVKKVHDKTVDKGAVKALVAVYGPRETARITGIPPGTIMGWCYRFKWKKVVLPRVETPATGNSKIANMDAGDALRHALAEHKTASTMNLAKFTENASKKAAEHKNPLEVARKVRDVAGVYSTLWPAETENELIESGILLGTQQVTENPEELKEIIDVRAELPDQ